MKSQTAMKDIIQHFGMSLNTIHKAITGKPGVGEQTRKRIVDYAAANGYKINSMASCLKCKEVQIVVCLPELDKSSVYFYNFIWRGYMGYMREWGDLSVQARELPFKPGELAKTLSRPNDGLEHGKWLDGILLISSEREDEVLGIKRLTKKGISVVLVTGDNTECQGVGVVVADYYAAGGVMVEQACNTLRGRGRMLFMAGNQYNNAHYMIAKSFHRYLQRERTGIQTENLYGYFEKDPGEEELLKRIQELKPDLTGCVFVRGSAVLAEAFRESGLSRTIPVIANDVLDESIPTLQDGTFTSIVYKDSTRQAYLATKMLCEYLVKGNMLEEQMKKVEIALIFEGNVNYYWEREDYWDRSRRDPNLNLVSTLGLVAEMLQNENLGWPKEQFKPGSNSRILCFSTEGDTDRSNYRRIAWDGYYPSFRCHGCTVRKLRSTGNIGSRPRSFHNRRSAGYEYVL